MPWPAGVPRGRRCGPGNPGRTRPVFLPDRRARVHLPPVTSTRPPGGHDCRTVGPPSCLSRPPPSAVTGRGRWTSFATVRSPTPPRLAPTPPPSWPTPVASLARWQARRDPAARRRWAALGTHIEVGKIATTAPWCGYGSPSAWTRCRFTPGLSIFLGESYWNARPPPGRPPRSTCVRRLTRTGCATSRPRSSRGPTSVRQRASQANYSETAMGELQIQ